MVVLLAVVAALLLSAALRWYTGQQVARDRADLAGCRVALGARVSSIPAATTTAPGPAAPRGSNDCDGGGPVLGNCWME